VLKAWARPLFVDFYVELGGNEIMQEKKPSSENSPVTVKGYAEYTLPRLRYMLEIDIDLCDGCDSCRVACKQENDLPVGVNRIQVIRIGPRKVKGKEDTYGLAMDFIPVMCLHCETPLCAFTCPEGAIKRSDNGIVLIDQEICMGCKACIRSCPFGVISFNYEKGVADKCSMCAHLLREGKEPACVRACPTGALKLVKIDMVGENKRRRTLLTVSSPLEFKRSVRFI